MPLVRQCIILNPAAGGAERGDWLPALGRLGPTTILPASAPGEATQLTRAAVADGYTRIVAAGGDGTLNEVINGLLHDAEHVELGLLPLGTANDFARTLQITDPQVALTALAAGRVLPIDVARLHSEGSKPRHFINVSAGGFSSLVNEKMEKSHKDWLGSLAYAFSAAKALPELEPYRLRVQFDDDLPLEADVYNVVVANARYVGGGIPVAPRALPDDGLLDVLLFRAVGLATLAALLPLVLAGQHLDSPDVIYRQARRITIAANPPLGFNTDGETVGTTPVTFESIPRKLRVIVPVPAEGAAVAG